MINLSLKQSSQTSALNRLSAWLKSSNQFFSSVIEESLTNLQVLLIIHAAVIGALLLSSIIINPYAAVVLLCWFGLAIQLCKKGGIK